MKPADYAAKGTEHAHQVALFMHLASLLPKYPEARWIYAIPNGGERNPIVASRLKAEGVRSGVSDICLPFGRRGYNGFYIEMKKPKGKETPQQIEFGAFLASQNYLYTMCDHWEKGRDAVEWYLQGTTSFKTIVIDDLL
jgi:hypothetical protein